MDEQEPDDELPDAACLMNEVMADDDLNDPYLKGYQQALPTTPDANRD